MRTLNTLTKKALISCATVATVGILAQGMFGSRSAEAQAAGGSGGSGGAAAGGSGGDPNQTPTCASRNLANPVFIAGSTAVQTVLDALGPKLATAATPLTLAYNSAGSCDGVNSIIGTFKSNAVFTYYDSTGAKKTCSVSDQTIDIGLSDVFPTSCPDVDQAALTKANVGQYLGPIQSMNFAVPAGASETSISAAAAYLTIGVGKDAGTDWNNPALFAFRNYQSGTETMIATAINLATTKWPGAGVPNMGPDKGGAGAVVSALKTPTGAVDQTLGILASNQCDDNRDTIKRLAYQGYKQTCAYYPDSSYASKDKANVRNGTYEIWGPLHILAKADASNVPTDAKAKQLIDVLTGATSIDGVDVTTLEITANTTPQCAMHVQRTSEIGTPTAFTPDKSCSCYFDSLRGDADAKAACATLACKTDADCASDKPACNFGFCEVK